MQMQLSIARLKFIEISNEIETKQNPRCEKNIYMSSNMTS